VLSVCAALPIAFLAYRAAVNPTVILLAKRCPRPCLWCLALGFPGGGVRWTEQRGL
jgi:hypothetical protein